jgi:hypothetical protein
MPSVTFTTNSATKRSYTGGHFELRIDDMPQSAFIKSIEGGWVKMNSVDEQVGSDNVRIKHATTVEVDPITIEVGMSQVDFLLKWINDSWIKEYARHSGSIITANFDYCAEFEHWFYDALIEETSIPTLDASSKDALFLKVKIRPERIEYKPGDGNKLQAVEKAKQKLWTASSFRLVIDGVDTSHVNKIEGFTVKQGIKPLAAGPFRLPQLEPTKIDFPDLSFHITQKYADDVFKWYKDVVIDGKKDPVAERTGAIEFLSPSRQDVLLRIKLNEVGIKQFSRPKMEANQDAIARCKVDLFVGSMELDGDARFGLE